MAVHKNQGWKSLTPAPNARFRDKARNRRPPTYIQRHTKAAAPGGAGGERRRELKRRYKRIARRGAPGPAELAGTLGGSQGAPRVVRARFASASSRRIPEPVAMEARAGTPVLSARTGTPLGDGEVTGPPRQSEPAV